MGARIGLQSDRFLERRGDLDCGEHLIEYAVIIGWGGGPGGVIFLSDARAVKEMAAARGVWAADEVYDIVCGTCTYGGSAP